MASSPSKSELFEVAESTDVEPFLELEPRGRVTSTKNVVRVNIDVGGHTFATSSSTLTSSRAEKSWFGPRFSGHYGDPVVGDTIFVDRNPKHFMKILDFLRDGWCVLPTELMELRELRKEAEFYCLQGLLDLIDKTPTMYAFYQELHRAMCRHSEISSREWLLTSSASEQEREAAEKCVEEVREALQKLERPRGQFNRR
eukprot:TRINITY_DN85163_c0_g1_i1.p1 TRINITY_DN85163_c0_g1~~TRINITY_DN85163_c0_g1_i1.p1  ORF type:complete len:211 (+),score=43.44 TRINITY_DN85163_c0_g1_i1:39-635(+)